MGFSTALLTFGYDLGSHFGYGATGDDRPRPDWFHTDPLSDEPGTLGENAYAALLAAAGFTERWTQERTVSWSRGRDSAARTLGLEIINTPLWDVDRWLISAAYVRTPPGEPGAITPLGAALPPVTDTMRTRLRWSLETLGFEPFEPQWHLVNIHEEWHTLPYGLTIADRTPTPES